jgi:hypothetical protein
MTARHTGAVALANFAAEDLDALSQGARFEDPADDPRIRYDLSFIKGPDGVWRSGADKLCPRTSAEMVEMSGALAMGRYSLVMS